MQRGKAQILLMEAKLWLPLSRRSENMEQMAFSLLSFALEHNPEYFHQLVIARKKLLEIYGVFVNYKFLCHVSASATESHRTYALRVIEYVGGRSNIKKSFLYDRATIYIAI